MFIKTHMALWRRKTYKVFLGFLTKSEGLYRNIKKHCNILCRLKIRQQWKQTGGHRILYRNEANRALILKFLVLLPISYFKAI